ncbi:MAG: hypothetical protein UR12_C0038G0011 [candidate division TM6 bacterium GW2011_GWF2_30_66]|nr:MAG: hypothetical protein UR12_C0038G0011 [candidate division TM6 bacterium GW2011_GWF2_30_66]
MCKNQFKFLFYIFFVFQWQNIYVMGEKELIVIKDSSSQEKKHFKGTFALFNEKREYEPMVVRDLEFEAICENLDQRIFRVINSSKQEDRYPEDPVKKVEQKEEIIGTDGSGFEDLLQESGGRDLAIVEKEDSGIILDEHIDLIGEKLHEDLAKILLQKGIGRNCDHGELLNLCGRALEKRGHIRINLERIVKNKKSKGLFSNFSGTLQDGLQDGLKDSSEGLINSLLEFLLADNKEQKQTIDNESKRADEQAELVSEAKKREMAVQKKNTCLTFLMPIVIAITPLISTLLSSGASTLTKYGLDLLSGANNSTGI